VDGNYRVEIYIHLLDPTSQESAAPESHEGRRLDSCQGPKVAVFAAVPGWWLGLINVNKFPLDNFHLQL
jgi:hypothetical protein